MKKWDQRKSPDNRGTDNRGSTVLLLRIRSAHLELLGDAFKYSDIFEKERHTFSFWISIALVKIYISCVIINRGKNTFELVGTVLKSA